MGKLILSNKNITGPAGALQVFNNIDLERLQSLGLKTKIIFYAENGKNGFSAVFKGPVTMNKVYDRPGRLLQEYVALPVPRYFAAGFLERELPVNHFPADLLLSQPSKIELMISAENKDQYEGLKAVRQDLIPDLLEAGYNKHNTNHTSEFWLRAGMNGTKESLLSVSYYGLDVSRTEVDGVKVFTESDLRRFREMRMKE